MQLPSSCRKIVASSLNDDEDEIVFCRQCHVFQNVQLLGVIDDLSGTGDGSVEVTAVA